MERKVKAYLAEIVRRGGRKSRSSSGPRDGAGVGTCARGAIGRTGDSRPSASDRSIADYGIGLSDVAWVAEQLRKHGGRDAWDRFEESVPLTDYQASLARLLSKNRTFDSYLAGGAAILIEPNTTRFSRDLDYFHDSEARVAEAFAADRRLLAERDIPSTWI